MVVQVQYTERIIIPSLKCETVFSKGDKPVASGQHAVT